MRPTTLAPPPEPDTQSPRRHYLQQYDVYTTSGPLRSFSAAPAPVAGAPLTLRTSSGVAVSPRAAPDGGGAADAVTDATLSLSASTRGDDAGARTAAHPHSSAHSFGAFEESLIATARSPISGAAYRTGVLKAASARAVSDALGFEPVENPTHDVTLCWDFVADGAACRVWALRGSRFGTYNLYGPHVAFVRIFGQDRVAADASHRVF